MSSPDVVFEFLATDAGRARFWAEAAREEDGVIAFTFPDGTRSRSRILVRDRPSTFVLEYLGEETSFELAADGDGGTDLMLTSTDPDRETFAGWVSVLLALKSAADFGVDLRNHDPQRTWSQGFVDN